MWATNRNSLIFPFQWDFSFYAFLGLILLLLNEISGESTAFIMHCFPYLIIFKWTLNFDPWLLAVHYTFEESLFWVVFWNGINFRDPSFFSSTVEVELFWVNFLHALLPKTTLSSWWNISLITPYVAFFSIFILSHLQTT